MEPLLGAASELRVCEKWRTDILVKIKIYYEVDSSFQAQTLRRKVYVCLKHFSKGDIKFTSKFLFMVPKRTQNPRNITLKEFYF